MKLPDLKKILVEDIKSSEPWVRTLVEIVNSFMNVVYIALNRNITFQENIRCIMREVTVNTSAAYPVQDPIKFPNTMTVKATGLWVTQCYERDMYVPVTGPVYASWVEDNGVITVSGLTGLSASKTYIVRFLVF